MSSDKDFERLIAEKMKSQAEEGGLDPNRINPEDVCVSTTGRTVEVSYGDAKVVLPAPSQRTLDEWFKENGQQIAGAMMALGGVVVGMAGAVGAAVYMNKNK
ncbi:MAG: hypothetical protein HGB10_03990 [Coriobacteriia bacterium]|nr:hypothetical protein [Coriobacteriia bacterium]